MHHAVHEDLKAFLIQRTDADTYLAVVKAAGLDPTELHFERYKPDGAFDAIVSEAGKLLGLERHALLEAIGEHSAPGLYEGFAHLVQPHWRTLEYIEAIEAMMHPYSRSELAAFPPVLKCERIDAKTLIVRYRSHRDMAGLAIGFIKGFAAKFGETVEITRVTEGDDNVLTIVVA